VGEALEEVPDPRRLRTRVGLAFVRILRPALYALLVASALLTFWAGGSIGGRQLAPGQARAAPILFGIFLVVFAVYRLALVRAKKYPAATGLFQIGLGALVWVLLLPGSMGVSPGPGSRLATTSRSTSPRRSPSCGRSPRSWRDTGTNPRTTQARSSSTSRTATRMSGRPPATLSCGWRAETPRPAFPGLPRRSNGGRSRATTGLASPRHFEDGQTRYEAAIGRHHHDHLICTSCHAIIEFENERIEELQDMVARQHGFLVTRHKLELYGLCKACQAHQQRR
jgi:hypothetical protein